MGPSSCQHPRGGISEVTACPRASHMPAPSGPLENGPGRPCRPVGLDTADFAGEACVKPRGSEGCRATAQAVWGARKPGRRMAHPARGQRSPVPAARNLSARARASARPRGCEGHCSPRDRNERPPTGGLSAHPPLCLPITVCRTEARSVLPKSPRADCDVRTLPG